MLKRFAVLTALMLALSAGTARADWMFNPHLGTTFGADANGNEHFTYGLSLGWMGAGIFGWEADLSYTPEFFESNDDDFDFTDTNNVVTWMANAIVGIPVGGQTGGGFRPYFTGGVGVLQTNIGDEDDLFNINNDEFGYNLGVGAMGFMSDHVGFRGDLRYFRAFGDSEPDGDVDLDLGNFDYWRGTVGVTFRW
jgi:hypothetical protein